MCVGTNMANRGVHMLKSAIAALGFVTHAMDLAYSSKMDLSTSFGFILALAAETCLLVNLGISW